MPLEIKTCKNTDHSLWDAFVDESREGTIFHKWTWLKTAERFSHSKLYPIMIADEEGIVSLLPLFLIKKFGSRLVMSPPPSVALLFLGPLYHHTNTSSQNRREIADGDIQDLMEDFIFQELKANYVHIGLSPYVSDLRPYSWKDYDIIPQYDYTIPISSDPRVQLEQLPKNLRQNINRAIKRGFSVEEGNRQELIALYEIMTDRYRDQDKSVTVPREYLLEIFDLFKDAVKIFVVKVNGEVITGCITVGYKDECISWIGSPKPKIQLSPSPNDLITWHELLYGSEQGLKNYIILGAAGNERLHRYYVKFNPLLRPRFSVKKNSFFGGLMESGYKLLKDRAGLRV